MNSIENFISLVPQIRLSIIFPYQQNLKSKVLDTIKQAVNSNVKELILSLENGDYGPPSFFPLPSFLYENSVLKRLVLSMCSFDSIQVIKWDSLKMLYMSRISLENSCVENIVSGCPVLEGLELCNCWGFSELNFGDLTKLKKFVLDGIWPKSVKKRKRTDSLSISAASVEVLIIVGNLDHKNLVLGDLNNCIEANIAYFWTFEENRPRPLTMKPVFNSLKNVQSLTCGNWIIKVASGKLEAEFPYALGNCDFLKLYTPVDCRHQLGIMRFIESCPDLGTLIIDIAPSPWEFKDVYMQTDEMYDPSMVINSEADRIRRLKFPSGFPFKALKTLCFDEETIYSSLPPFIKYLVVNTTGLVGKRLLSLDVVFLDIGL